MSTVLAGSVFSRRPFDADMATAIDRVLRSLAQDLQSTRKGRVWSCRAGDCGIGVSIEDLDQVLCHCEDELLEHELLPEPGMIRVFFFADLNLPQAAAEIDRLSYAVAEAIDGATFGSRRFQ